jgi:hypothetical protein
MSFFDDIIGGAKDIFGGILGGGSGTIGSIISAVVTGFALNKMSKSVSPTNNTPAVQAATPDYGVRLQVPPSVDQKVPVLYGSSIFGGIITDAVLANDNKTMYYVITLCEKTGTKISDDLASTFEFENIYWDDNRIVFDTNGTTALYTIDRDGNIDKNIAGLVDVYCYAGNSSTPVGVKGYNSTSLVYAYNIVPNWTVSHSMDDLVFAIIKIKYNKDSGLVGLPNVTFDINNSMTLPGDCLYDYMTNTRYGAGIPNEEIYSE